MIHSTLKKQQGFILIVTLLWSMLTLFMVKNMLENYFASQNLTQLFSQTIQQKYKAKETLFKYIEKYHQTNYTSSSIEQLILKNMASERVCLNTQQISTNCSYLESDANMTLSLFVDNNNNAVQSINGTSIMHLLRGDIKIKESASKISNNYSAIIAIVIDQNNLINIDIKQFWRK